MQALLSHFRHYALYVAAALLTLALDGCGDHLPAPPTTPTTPPTGDFSDDIKRVISQDNLDKIRALGVTVCEGKTVANLEGIFFSSPVIMTKTTVPSDPFSVGDRFVDYRYRIKNQNGTQLIAEVDTKGISFNSGAVVDEATGATAYLSGSGNCFTLFVIVEGKFTGTTTRYRQLEVFTGEKTAQGVSNFQNGLLMLEDYGDVNNTLIPVNSGRAFKDGDGFSPSQNTFRLAATNKVTAEAQPKAYLKN